MDKRYINITKRRLKNSLKGQALSVVNNVDENSFSVERKNEMEVIEEFLKYIENFEENQEKLKELDFYKERLIDDGR